MCTWHTFITLSDLFGYLFAQPCVCGPTGRVPTSRSQNTSFWYRMAYVFVVGKIQMTKYLTVWLINEASCIFTGIR